MLSNPAAGLQNLREAEEVLGFLEFLLFIALAQHERGLASVPVCLTEGIACVRRRIAALSKDDAANR